MSIVIQENTVLAPHTIYKIGGMARFFAEVKNASELAEWLNAELVTDDWRPVKLHQGVYLDGEIEFQ